MCLLGLNAAELQHRSLIASGRAAPVGTNWDFWYGSARFAPSNPVACAAFWEDVRRDSGVPPDVPLPPVAEPIGTAPRTGASFVGCEASGYGRCLCFWDAESGQYLHETGGPGPDHWLDDATALERLQGTRR